MACKGGKKGGQGPLIHDHRVARAPGDVFVNDTDKILYQLVCSLVNTCGVCYQNHLAIAKWWPKFHHGCSCQSRPVYPGQSSEPYRDWRDDRRARAPERDKVVGKANMQLIDAGVVKWTDVVTSNRVRLLREVVSREKLTIDQMTGAGVKPRTAREAYATVHTPAHELAARQRTELLKQILDLGIQPKHLTEMFGEIMARRIGIAAGPSGKSPMPPGRSDTRWVRILQESLRPRPPAAAPPTRPDLKAQAEESLGVAFVEDPAARDDPEYTTVVVDVAKVDADLAKDPAYYVGPGGTGAAIGGRYEAFLAYLAKARESGKPIEQSRVTLGTDGTISIPDGRHRFAVLRDLGATTLPVTVHESEAAAPREIRAEAEAEELIRGRIAVICRRHLELVQLHRAASTPRRIRRSTTGSITTSATSGRQVLCRLRPAPAGRSSTRRSRSTTTTTARAPARSTARSCRATAGHVD